MAGLHCSTGLSLLLSARGWGWVGRESTLFAVHGLLIAVASVVSEHGFRIGHTWI